MGDKSKLKIGTYQNPNSGRSKESIDRYVKGMREKKYGGKRINTDRIRKFKTGMTPGQAKIAAKAPPPNKIDEKDFAVLRAEKAKGRGMGLQDEKVKPGKVKPVKAVLGIAAMGLMGAKYLKDKNKKATPMIGGAAELMKKKKELLGKKMGGKIYKAKRGMSFSDKMKAVEDGKINKKTGKPTSMAAMRKAKGFKPGESASEFNKRRMALEVGKKALKATTVGKIALGVGAAGVAAQQYLKSKMNKKKDVKKKMGGGMMQKPMGYSKGGGYDSGNPGKLRDIVTKYAGKFKSKDRLTERDIETANKILKGGRGKALRGTQEMISRLKKFDSAKKMGGGMMQKPMGYNKGVMVKARGCKLGRTKPTKIT